MYATVTNNFCTKDNPNICFKVGQVVPITNGSILFDDIFICDVGSLVFLNNFTTDLETSLYNVTLRINQAEIEKERLKHKLNLIQENLNELYKLEDYYFNSINE